MLRKVIVAGLGGFAFLAAGSALAQECTEAAAEAKSQELFEMIQADPAKAERLEAAIAEVEAEYGGEPTEAQACDAIDKLMAKLKS